MLIKLINWKDFQMDLKNSFKIQNNKIQIKSKLYKKKLQIMKNYNKNNYIKLLI